MSKSTIFSVKIMAICKSIRLNGYSNESKARFLSGG